MRGYSRTNAAPFTCALYAILLQAMRHLRVWRPGNQPLGLALVRIIPIVCLMLVGLRLCSEPLHLSIPRWPTMWYGTAPLGLPPRPSCGATGKLRRPTARYRQIRSRTCPVRRLGVQRSGYRQVESGLGAEMETRNSLELLRYFRDRRSGWWNRIPIRRESHPIAEPLCPAEESSCPRHPAPEPSRFQDRLTAA